MGGEEEEEVVCTVIDPSLVTFPIPLVTLAPTSVDAYSSPCSRNITNNQDPEEEEVCAVCLDNLYLSSNSNSNLSDRKEVRQLIHNCHHAFHKGCLHDWVAGGRVTCPVCRAKLLADHRRRNRDQEDENAAQKEFRTVSRDPWRLERMIYLFGEDIMF